jgi:predicted phage terminase large subunit-like protein
MTAKQLNGIIQSARSDLLCFTQATLVRYQRTKIHEIYATVLDAFAKGEIKKLIISMPPQHGKSEIASRHLPAFILGLNPELKIIIGSYSQSQARKFGRDVHRIIASPKYKYIFPNTRTANMVDRGYAAHADRLDIVGHEGSLSLAGRGSGITGDPCDIFIFDDLYKNLMEANSPIIRESVIDWYKAAAETRLHNDSRQLIVFTRWHQEDLVGFFESKGLVDDLVDVSQIKKNNPERWLKLNLPAIKEGPPFQLDPREPGTALWPARHSLARLVAKREQDQEVFDSLYQGNPRPSKGLLYEGGFQLYDTLPDAIIERWGYVDTADEGDDFLAAGCAVSGVNGGIYITDILYTQDGMETTEPLTADMFIRNATEDAYIESNAGGRAFARKVRDLVDERAGMVRIHWFHQSKNKEARILTNAANVRQNVYFPREWKKLWPKFANDVLGAKKNIKANTHDDALDFLTGLYEKWQNKQAGQVQGGASAGMFGF